MDYLLEHNNNIILIDGHKKINDKGKHVAIDHGTLLHHPSHIPVLL